MTTILLTGASGFVGKHFLSILLKENHTVRILVRSLTDKKQFPANVEVIQADLTQPNTLINACENIDTIYHLAGYAHAWNERHPSFAVMHHAVNYEGTKNLLNEAIRAQVKKFIYFSSVKATADSPLPIDETWQQPPQSPYGIAKKKAEELVLQATTHGMHTTILRPSLVYGAHCKGNLANMIRAIDRGYFPPLPETNNIRSMISIDDLCHAALMAASSPTANGKIYIVTDQVPYSTRQLYTLIRIALGKKILFWHIPFFIFRSCAALGDFGTKITGYRLPFNTDALNKLFGSAQYDSSLIQHELGFKPYFTLEKLLPDIIDAYKDSRSKTINGQANV